MIISSYDTLIKRLFDQRTLTRRKDLALMEALFKALGHPHRAFPIIHIAGTNGKGQVAAKIAYALEKRGLKVGLFTSPHLFTFEERITINQEKIPREEVIKKEAQLRPHIHRLGLQPNFFEYCTSFAFSYFKEKQVDIAIIEAGLGGRLDPTNIVHPLLSIITSISLDHTEILGHTIEEIAAEKAGIIKPRTPVLIGPRAQLPPIFARAKEMNAPVFKAEETSLFFEEENQAIAREALEILKQRFCLKNIHIEAGIQKRLPCRFERKENVIYDVAHNPDGFRCLLHALEHFFPKKTFRFVIGMSKNKAIKDCLSQITPKAKYVHFVQAKNDFSASPKQLGEIFASITCCPFSLESSVEEGVKRAKAATKSGEILVICGSFYIMDEAVRLEEHE